MTDSHDAIHRLIDADPVRTSPIEYPVADALVRSAVTTSARPRIGVAFRAKVASAVLGASLLTGAGITALQASAPSLPVLSLSSSPATSNASDSKVAGSMLRPISLSDFRFDGSQLASLSTNAPVWKVTPPSDLREFQQIARALGLEGSVVHPNDGINPSSVENSYTISDPNRGTLTYSNWSDSGLGTWWFNLDSSVTSSNASSNNSSSTNGRTKDEYAQWAQDFVASLGLDYQFSQPDIYPYDSPDMQSAGASASFTLLLDGLKTSVGLYVSMDGSGRVTSASGSLGRFERVGNYPLTGVANGVTRLQQENDANLDSTPNAGVAQASGSGSSDSSSPDVSVDAAPSSTPTVVNVNLTTVETQLQLATVNGEWYLIPYYVFGGSAVAQDNNAGAWDGTWTVVAVSSEYITIEAPTVTPMAAR